MGVSEVTSTKFPLAGLRVLVVDDDNDEREMYAFVLERYGAEVVAVESAPRALGAFERMRFDVMVSDLCLPETDGCQLIEELHHRARDTGAELHAVAVTGLTEVRDRARALEAGFDLYLAKPVSLDTLAAAVAELAGASRPTEAA
jgi:CheY-like chemotaxis protein